MIAFDQEQPDNVIAMPTKSNEWYTPARYIEAARTVMGSIDLDPASCKEANRVVRAEKFYTMKDNGLEQPWYGNVYLNPPFSAKGASRGMEPGRIQGSVIKLWLNRLISQYTLGAVSQAIFLTKTDMKASWFHTLWDYPICFARDHLYFYRPNLQPEKHFFGTCFVYLGANEQRFIDIFSKFGRIAKAIDTPKARPINLSLWEAL